MVVWGASQVALVVKNQYNAGDVRDLGSIPGLRSSPGGGHGNPLQDSCLENPMHRGTWLATVHGVAKSQTRLGSSSGVVGTREAGQHQRPWPSRLPQPQAPGSSPLHLRPSAAVNTHLVSSTYWCGPRIKGVKGPWDTEAFSNRRPSLTSWKTQRWRWLWGVMEHVRHRAAWGLLAWLSYIVFQRLF